jgi:hypothetical protein
MKYYIKDQGMTVEDAYTLPKPFWTDMRSVAEDAAEHFHIYHDGWECSWPITFTIVNDAGQEFDVEVDRRYDPVFVAGDCKG